MVLIEQDDEWMVARRYLCEHSLKQLLDDAQDGPSLDQQDQKAVIQLTAA